MRSKFERVNTVLLGLGAVAAVYIAMTGIFGTRAVPVASAQSGDPFLSRRVDQIENRLYQIESKVDRVDLEARRTASPPATSIIPDNNAEIRLLRTEVESLRLRLGEAECGLLKLDERTLSPAARAARKKALAGGTENCRADPAAAVVLSSRP